MMEFSEEELQEILTIFQEESEEQVQKLNDSFLALESNPQDANAIQTIFREAHSLKGAARMIGLDDIQTIAHKLEDIFDLARKGEFEIKSDVIDVLCSSVDSIANIIESTIKTQGTHNIDVQSVVQALETIEKGGTISEQKPSSPESLSEPTKNKSQKQKKKSKKQMSMDISLDDEEPEDEIPFSQMEPGTILPDQPIVPVKKQMSMDISLDDEEPEDEIPFSQMKPGTILPNQSLGKSFVEEKDVDPSEEDMSVINAFTEEELVELKQIFYVESKQNIEIIDSGIEKLNKFPYDREILIDVYRSAHSIEGSARLINFVEIKNVSTLIRDILQKAVNDDLFVSTEVLSVLGRYVKHMKALIEQHYKGILFDRDVDIRDLQQQISEKMDVYKEYYEEEDKKNQQKKKNKVNKMPLSSDSMNFDEEEVLKDLGVSKTPSESYVSQEYSGKTLDIDPLSLSEEELGDLEIGSLQGVIPVSSEEIKKLQDAILQQSGNQGEDSISFVKGFVDAFQAAEKEVSSKETKPLKVQQKSESDDLLEQKVSEIKEAEDLSVSEMLDNLSVGLKQLTKRFTDKALLKTLLGYVLQIKEIAVLEDKKHLLAIIVKVETIFTEVTEKQIQLNDEIVSVIDQCIESVILMNTRPEDVTEDPGLLYQRLTIVHQAARLSAGMPVSFDSTPSVFDTPEEVLALSESSQPPKKTIEKKIVEEKKIEIIDSPKIPESKPKTSEPYIPKAPPPVASSKNQLAKTANYDDNMEKTANALFKSKSDLMPSGASSGGDKSSGIDSYTIKTLRVDTRKLDQLVAQVGELIIAKIKAKERLLDVEKLINLVDEWQRDCAKNKYAVKGSGEKTLKSAFMLEGTSIYTPGKDIQTIIRENYDMLGKLASQLNLLYYNIQEDDTRLSLIINELEERIKNVRLLPLATIFNMFPRMVRDIARHQNKEVELEIRGSETTVDKKIIEELKSPLMHIIRNSIDHGIELPLEREKNQKKPNGTVVLSASHLENSVLIEISDDGRGINLDAIKEKVLEKELLTESELEAMSETQIMNIIFWPGFSTGSEITDISGRGVGMDVVHNKITQLNGKVRVKSKLGESCSVSIQLPVTMATIQVFLVKIAKQAYAIPASAIKTALLIKPEDIFYKEGRQNILVDGVPVALCNLVSLLELPSAEVNQAKKEKMTVLVLQTEDFDIGFIVDGLLGDQEILHKNLEPPFVRVRNVAGVTTLGSGEVCLILNVGDLIKTAQMNYGMGFKANISKQESKSKKKDILVVDDSVTTRILERNILRAAGYNVVVAVNGLDALTKLAIQSFDLVVSDVEMPDITGFELVSRLRKDESLSKMPVILVTSLASEADRQKGMNAGASAYITKGGFDQEELLSTIRRLL